jgi:hypothetical protein
MATLPVAEVHVGGVTIPAKGAAGVGGCSLITRLADAGETHPYELVTVKVYVPAGIVAAVKVAPSPVLESPPGERVKVHVPDAGNPLNATLPVELIQVGLVIVPINGAAGIGGGGVITAFDDISDVQPITFVTSKV